MHSEAPEVLIVDDDAPLVEVVQIALDGHGYRVRTAADGRAALQSVEQDWPDLLLLDVMLPECDGFEVCAQVRARQPEGHRLPIILLSALDAGTYKGLGLSYGADDYLAKPFQLDELLAKVRAWSLPDSTPDR